MSATAPAVPYEKQFDMQASRTCGAACLSMVYRSFGQEIPQRLIWPLIAKKNAYGSIASTTHLMAADAISRGFAAVVIQARHPLQALRICRDSGIRAILNHRLKSDSPAGHYTVFVDIDETQVTLHDPYFGASRRLKHDVLLDLWLPRLPNSEIVGNFLIGVASEPHRSPACSVCHTPLLPALKCPRCKDPIGFEPDGLLACLNNACSARMWNYVCCPTCDLTWSFSIETETPKASAPASATPAGATSLADSESPASPLPSASEPSASASSTRDPMNLAQLFGEIDKFCNQILSIPAAADHSELKQQLDFINASKEKLIRAQAEALVNRELHQDQLATMVQASRQRQEAHQKKLDELSKPLAPLDGDALARALLKHLGITS
jgi:hypothetical protein